MKLIKEELEYVIKNYEKTDKEEILNNLKDKTWKSIKHIGNRHNIKRITKFNNEWKEYEIDYLIENYENTEKEIIINYLKYRTWTSIKLMSGKLKLNRSNDFFREANMNKLTENNNNAFYWMGFLSADGNFSNNRISLTLTIKDLEHINKFAYFVETKNIILKENICSVSLKNIDIFDNLCNKFNLKNTKTYSPPDFSLFDFSKELFFSYIIGFIDGDGNIQKLIKRKDCNIRIHLHSSWLNNLIYIENFLYDYFDIEKDKILSKIGNDEYSRMIISNSLLIGKVKKEVIRLNLPYMERKWNIINENFISKYEISKMNNKKIIDLYIKGISAKEIMKITGFKKGMVYLHIRNYKNNIKYILNEMD